MNHGSIISHRSPINNQQSGLHVINQHQSVQDANMSAEKHSLGIILTFFTINSDYYTALLDGLLKDEIAKNGLI